MKYNSNQVVKSAEYEFEICISRATLRTKFPCQFYTSLKYRADLPELVSPEAISVNGSVQFNHTHRFVVAMGVRGGEDGERKVGVGIMQVTLSVGLRSKHRPLEKIIAGFVTIDLWGYLNHSHPTKLFKIERCPDHESVIQIAIRSNKIRDISAMENDQKLISKIKYCKSQVIAQIDLRERPSVKKSCIVNRYSNTEEQQQQVTAVSGSFSKLLNTRKREGGNLNRVLTPDKEEYCQLSFARMKGSCVSRSLNYDEVTQSMEGRMMGEVSNFDMEGKERWEQGMTLRVPEKQDPALQLSPSKLKQKDTNSTTVAELSQTNQTNLNLKTDKSVIQESTCNNLLTQKQILSSSSDLYQTSIKNINKQHPFVDLNLLEKNRSLMGIIGEMRDNLQGPIKELQEVLQGQLECYEEESSWEALRLLRVIAERLNMS